MNDTAVPRPSGRKLFRTVTTGATAIPMGGSPPPTAALPGDAASEALVRLETDPQRPLITFLSWDTEGGRRVRTNLLRSPGAYLRVRPENLWLSSPDVAFKSDKTASGARYRITGARNWTLIWDISTARGRFALTFSVEGEGTPPAGGVELVFPLDVTVTPTTVIASAWRDGVFSGPTIISAPDFGQMLMSSNIEVTGRLDGNVQPVKLVDLILELPPMRAGQRLELSFTPVYLPPPQGLGDTSLWRLARRGWFNSFVPSARQGNAHDPHLSNAVAGILTSKVVGGAEQSSLALFSYADPMLWTPDGVAGISLAPYIRAAVEFWLNERTLSSREVLGYADYAHFLDANPNVVLAAWDYVEATGDLGWLEKYLRSLEQVADYSAFLDQDNDGLAEAVQSGNLDTLWTNNRSSNWFDAVNYGYKDAYSNALIYRAWRCLADLEARLHRGSQRAHYTRLANRLRSAYQRELYNPQTGWIVCWKSQDGQLHDYASTIINGLAITYGLIEPGEGRKILDRLWNKMQAVGFNRFELGIPSLLAPVPRKDFMQPNAFGIAQREDGTDTFQQYQNGGIFAGLTLPFLTACYRVGQNQRADTILRAMLARQQEGGFQNGIQPGYPHGGEWTTWDGKPSGYEGYQADNYYFLQAVLLREPAFLKRYLKPYAAPA